MTEISASTESFYSYDDIKIDQIRLQKLWMNDPKYFKRIALSPSAVIKMMAHGQSGVEKGISKGGKPIEVMGLLLGRPDTEDPQQMVIVDVQPLPIEGFETRVVADDESVLHYMIELGDSNELTRKERFCGWYHTHPFDADNCLFLSSTDITTQLQWQRSEDPHGNPWIAIVIDPIKSISKGRPEFSAFRVYPPDFSAPANETPDGTIVADDSARVEKWGAVWNRYYQLKTHYFMSSLSQSTLSLLKHKFLWQQTLSAASEQDADYKKETVAELEKVDSLISSYHHSNASTTGSFPMFRPFSTVINIDGKKDDISRANHAANNLSVESCQCCINESIRKLIFSVNHSK